MIESIDADDAGATIGPVVDTVPIDALSPGDAVRLDSGFEAVVTATSNDEIEESGPTLAADEIAYVPLVWRADVGMVNGVESAETVQAVAFGGYLEKATHPDDVEWNSFVPQR